MARRISIALDRYDRHVPFFLNQLNVPEQFELQALEVGMVPPRRHGIDRHARMLKRHEFDAAEVSLASYIIAKSRGAPFIAIPVFPRRLFSQNHVFVADQSPYRTPKDLSGKRVIVWAFQVTMSVLAKGDFKRDHGLDWRNVEWLTQYPEEIDVPGLPIRMLSPAADPIKMLRDGDADAFIHPHPPEEALSGHDGIRRLFANPAAECAQYVKRHGYLPIMHLIALKEELVKAEPGLPRTLMRLWDDAKAIADDFYHDPGYALEVRAQQNYRKQKSELGNDLWPSSFNANRANMEHFVEDMVDQKLLDRPIAIEQLFHPSTIET